MRGNRSSMGWIVILAGITVIGAQVRGGDQKSFRGFIADSQCALNVHSVSKSHKEMIAMKPEIKTRTDCVRYCVKERGGKYVLLVGSKVYKLDAQTAAEPLAGQEVKVLGTLDAKTGIITVHKIAVVAADQDSPSTY